MTYATLELLSERYTERLLLQLTDRASPPSGAIDVGTVDRALADTDAVIDGFLAGRYVLPIAETPPLLVDLALAIAIYKLHPFSPEQKIKDDYGEAIGSLKMIASGTIRLPIDGVEPQGSEASGVVVIDRERPLTPENLTGFI